MLIRERGESASVWMNPDSAVQSDTGSSGKPSRRMPWISGL
jgi:hypothetical protein